MASPFALFRKNQKILMAVFGMMAMIAFVFIDSMGNTKQQDPNDVRNKIVAETNDLKISEVDLDIATHNRQTVHRFLSQALAAANEKRWSLQLQQEMKGSTPQAIQERFENDRAGIANFWHSLVVNRIGSTDERTIVSNLVLADLAKKSGVVVSDQRVVQFINEFLAQFVTQSQMIGARFQLDPITGSQLNKVTEGLKGVSGQPITQRELNDAFRTELLAHSLNETLAQAPASLITPLDRWNYYTRQKLHATAEVVAVRTSEFVNDKKVPTPQKSVLVDFFDKYKFDEPELGSPDPGFKIPQKSAFQYFAADEANFQEPEKITAVEIADHYEKNKARYPYTPEDFSLPPKTPDPKNAEPKPTTGTPGATAPAPTTTTPAATPSATPSATPTATPSATAAKTPATTPAPTASPSATAAPSATAVPKPSASTSATPSATAPAAGSCDPTEETNDACQTPAATPSASPSASPTASAAATPKASATPSATAAPSASASATAAPSATPSASAAATPTASATPSGTAATAPAAPAAPAPVPVIQPQLPNENVLLPDDVRTGNDPQYDPLWKVEERIRTELAEAAARKRIDIVFEELRSKLNQKAFTRPYTSSKDDVQQPLLYSAEQWKDLAKSHPGLTAETTGLLGRLEVVAQADQPGLFHSTIGGSPFAQVVFSSRGTYIPTESSEIPDANSIEAIIAKRKTVRYLFWKTADIEARVPDFEEARKEVELAWQNQAARDLARNLASEMAKKVVDSPKTMKELFPDREPKRTNAFSWYKPDLSGGFNRRQSSLELSQVDNVEDAGPEFMEAVFSLNDNEVAVAFNNPKTICYVIRAESILPPRDRLYETFMADPFRMYAQYGESDENMMRYKAIRSLLDQSGLRWIREPKEFDPNR